MEKTMNNIVKNCGVIGMNGELDEIMTKDYIPPCEPLFLALIQIGD